MNHPQPSDSFKRLSPSLSFPDDLLSTFVEASSSSTTTSMVGLPRPLSRAVVLLLGLALLAVVDAQSSSNSSPSSSSPTHSPTESFSISTSTSVSNVVSGSLTLQVTSTFPVTYLYPLSSSTTPTSTASPSATSPAEIRLHTTVDPGFGVLGALLILTGIPSAFLGHKNRWYTFQHSTVM